ETVLLSCGQTDQCGKKKSVYWYQKTERDPFKVILRIDLTDGKVNSRFNHPQKNDFSASRKQNGCELMITKVKVSHSATYYCACDPHTPCCVWPQPCFPPLVKFSWKRQKEDGDLTEVHHDVGDPEKLKESGCTASILLIRQHESSTYKYRCSVQHEGGTVEAQTEQELPAPPTSTQPTSTPSPPPSAPPPAASPPSQYKVKLLCLLYTVLIVKSLVYCCGLSLLMILRNKGPSTSCTHAD
ncbi:hypothetical protein GBF38_000756, partial [Nibea albiflora]